MVSFTFDDVYSNACTQGGDMIRAADGHATYYVCGKFDRSRGGAPQFYNARELVQLYQHGHEIGCHGFGHLDYQSASIELIRADIEANRIYFVDRGLPIPKNFAYPYGHANRRVKSMCAAYFNSCRGAQHMINRGAVDLEAVSKVVE